MKPTWEEINYFTHPDRAWLQKLWEPAVGDWVYSKPYNMIRLVIDVDTVSFHGGHYPIFTNVGEGQPYLGKAHGCQKDEVIWLPTLSDLVRLIEQKKRSWSLQGYFQAGTYPAEDTLDYDGLVWQVGGVVEYEIFFDYGRVSSATIIAAELLEKLKNETDRH